MTSPRVTLAQPVAQGERIVALDVLRGFAVLGILVMNIQAFAMPPEAYTNPAAFGDLEGINRWVWIVSHVATDQKFMAIFSMLFGAGVCLFADRARARSGRSTGVHYRRTLLLLLVGVAHGYLLFYGDILVAYALCALWVYWMRNRRPRSLVIVGSLLLAVPPAINLLLAASLPGWPEEAVEEMRAGWAPPAAQIEATVAGMRGSFGEQLATRAQTTAVLQTVVFALVFFWRVSGMMLFGMALYRWGVLTADRKESTYRVLAVTGLVLGASISGWGVLQNFRHGWSLEYSMFAGTLPNYVSSILVAIGYVAVVMLVVRRGLWPALQARLASTGQMALTNYLMQSVICVVVFNLFGLYGAVERWGQVIVVVAVWAVQLLYSPLWLARFRMGPCEWLWRAATYGRLPPLRR